MEENNERIKGEMRQTYGRKKRENNKGLSTIVKKKKASFRREMLMNHKLLLVVCWLRRDVEEVVRLEARKPRFFNNNNNIQLRENTLKNKHAIMRKQQSKHTLCCRPRPRGGGAAAKHTAETAIKQTGTNQSSSLFQQIPSHTLITWSRVCVCVCACETLGERTNTNMQYCVNTQEKRRPCLCLAAKAGGA